MAEIAHEAGVSDQFLDLTFPFYFSFDENLCLLQIGPSLSKMDSQLQPGAPVGQCFRLLRPPNEALTAAAIRANLRQVFQLELASNGIGLKGQMLYLPSAKRFLFLGSPAVKKVTELIAAQLTLNDFALHDNTTEYLFVMQAYQQQMDLRLAEKNKALEDQRHEIEAQNEELRQQQEEIRAINDQLEHTVQLRTEELNRIIDELSARNQNLEQFSYIVSHNMRAPVARVLGLLSLFDRQMPNNPFNQEILQYLDDSAQNLNTVIADLSEIITIQKHWDKAKEPIDLQSLGSSVLDSLQEEITRSGAMVTLNFGQLPTIYSLKTYLQSILFNLVSNALKYRAPGRPPYIDVAAEVAHGLAKITVRDNGLGIDLNKTSLQQIFGLYKRLHFHIEGKGLGLYLVKTQVEALQGRIEVESTPNIGTNFTVYLPNATGGASAPASVG
jgi:signal transduction histidine kinase